MCQDGGGVMLQHSGNAGTRVAAKTVHRQFISDDLLHGGVRGSPLAVIRNRRVNSVAL